jgi:hypothetical protein
VGGDRRYGVLLMAAYMLLQQGLTFLAKQRTLLAFGTVFFGSLFFFTLFDIWDFQPNMVGLVMGASLMCIAYALSQSRHGAIAGFWYFVGSTAFLWAVFDKVRHTPLEVLYLGLTALVIFLFELVVAAVAAYWLAGEVMTYHEWVGGSLIVAASSFAARAEEV